MLSLTDPLCIELSKMTATVIIYTNQGFAIAADGLELWEDPDTHQRSLRPGGDRIRICLPRRKEDDNTGTRLQRQVERLSGLDRNDWIRGPRDLVS
jgi:hypothetical protein